MFGGFLDAAMGIPNNMHKEEMQDDAQHHDYMAQYRNQEFNREEAEKARSWNAWQNEAGRSFNSAMAVEQRAWAEKMSNTQHQRQIQDLKAAGLNPILSARAGAGVPSGASAASQGGSGAAASSSGGGGSGGGSGGSVHSNFAAAQVMEDQKELIRADRNLRETQRHLTAQDFDLRREETNTQEEITRRAKADADTATADAKGRTNEGNIDDTTVGNILRWINRISESIQGTSSAAQRARPR